MTSHQSHPPGTCSTAEVSVLTGLTARQIIYWVNQGWVKPSGYYGVGPGNHWRWTVGDVLLLASAADRIAWGLQPERALTADPGPCPPLAESGSLH